MGLISPTQITDGTSADAGDVNTPINQIVNEFNGNIEDANIKSGAAINASKLADATVTPTKMSSIKLNGVGGAYSGTPPAANGTFQVQAGTIVVTTDGGGNSNFNWPVPFTTGVLTVLLTEGDANSGNFGVSVIASSTNTTGVALHVGSAGAGSFRVNYFAIGW